ncbi:methionine ABC transporter ATP-binding protein [Mucilaginibacter conchicola]|uniref:Methionine ABC transporter ATP-binding protein n=1 Tax=Mucilaginibacter conchicola TaxID=2303333 RepID=A0A372NVG9_9SPHI|nr:methionine ABC transporter ATP-binding protein [Mucilaginibacter conchicola]RFZ94002.1 methionine ABC transporter ATP-binding protein [Mucilaginibacter conchicola]
MIELKDITKTFRQKNKSISALSGVSLKVERGRIFGIIGPSGAGKSTLIRCVNLLEKPDTGEVIVDGQNLLTMSASQLADARRHIGMIFQHFNLLSSRTVHGNIAFPLELAGVSAADIDTRVNELLSLVGLEDKKNNYPASLSGGQKQRVAIARALATNPKVLLCDEATSALDPSTTNAILNLLKDINRKLQITILLITHEMEVVRTICDDVALISDGKIAEQLPVHAIFSNTDSVLAKSFIGNASVEIPQYYQDKLNNASQQSDEILVKVTFAGQPSNSQEFGSLSREYGVNVNIISGRLEHAGDVKYGALLITLKGSPDNRENALAYLQQDGITTELIGHVG